MCGIAGFYRPGGFSASFGLETVKRLSAALVHRGPDDEGAWVDGDAGIAFGHRRLSILDLSPAGHQPMKSASGRYVIVYNGEVYNHLAVRGELERSETPPAWRGHSDTEVLLAAIERWGIEKALVKTTGMFAFALWDRDLRTLTLVRDRLGEKPLYYGWQGPFFLFGSELKAMRRHPAFDAEVDRNALAMYVRRGYTVAPCSIYRDIFKLPPASYVQLTETDPPATCPKPQIYWSLNDVVARGSKDPCTGDDEEAANELEAELNRAIALQRIADVPLGAFLSGGIDSTAVVALLQAQSSQPVKTFTIGFYESKYDEAPHAKAIARHLGTDHTELHVTPRKAMEVIPELPLIYDEPFGDSSAIPTCLVAELARQHVTVSLSGDGGDELFGGYTRYQRSFGVWRNTRSIPNVVRNAISQGLRVFPRHRQPPSIAWKANRLARYMSARNIEEFYDVQMSQQENEHDLVLRSACKSSTISAQSRSILAHDHFYDAMMRMDAQAYLPDDILVKVDRAAMSVSLEARVPMLDHEVVEFAWRLPLHMKVRANVGKWLLRQVVRKYVPDSLLSRPKMGFGVPVGQWICGPLRDWAEDLLAETRLRQDGYLNPELVRNQWSQHLHAGTDGGDNIWTLLMFQAWLSSQTAT